MTLEEEIAGLKASMANANETIKHLENRIIDLERAMRGKPPKRSRGFCACGWRALAPRGTAQRMTNGVCDACQGVVYTLHGGLHER